MDGSQRQGCPNCQRLEREHAGLDRRVAELEALVARLQSQIEQLSQANARLSEANARLRDVNTRLSEANAQLTAALEEARRGGKRQAAPFSKHPPKKRPKKPGRKPGDAYGRHARRAAPAPHEIDETYEVPLPGQCPHCGDRRLQETGTVEQFQTEIPRRPIHRRFDIHVGRCTRCGKRVQGRHALQTSEATGAAAVQLGPEAHAALAILNKRFGLSHGKCARVLGELFGIRIARATSARSIRRSARRCQPAYEQIRTAVRGSPVVSADETGWRVGGHSAWLHVFVGQQATCYVIDPTRSHAPAEALLGLDWSGTLIHDGWSPYRHFWQARHQQCLAHLLRRCRELLETATRGAVRFPRAVKKLLKQALRLRDRYAVGIVSPRGLASARGQLQARFKRLVWPTKRNAANERFAAHLARHLPQLFTFLTPPGTNATPTPICTDATLTPTGIDATNWRAEQALRPAVVNRKVWGGNRTTPGAHAQAVLMSVLETCRQQAHSGLDLLSHTLRCPAPLALLPTMR